MKQKTIITVTLVLGLSVFTLGHITALPTKAQLRSAGEYLARQDRTLARVVDRRNNPHIDFPGYLELGKEVYAYRRRRRVSEREFIRMAKEPDTIILDTRSRDKYEMKHIAGAKHLNFSDFTEESLAKVIPSKDTRILIYCNNNFDLRWPESARRDRAAFATKAPALALNIPTFVNLYGYGYKNIYELRPAVDMDQTELRFGAVRSKAGKEASQ